MAAIALTAVAAFVVVPRWANSHRELTVEQFGGLALLLASETGQPWPTPTLHGPGYAQTARGADLASSDLKPCEEFGNLVSDHVTASMESSSPYAADTHMNVIWFTLTDTEANAKAYVELRDACHKARSLTWVRGNEQEHAGVFWAEAGGAKSGLILRCRNVIADYSLAKDGPLSDNAISARLDVFSRNMARVTAEG